jgi:hypothetical protein
MSYQRTLKTFSRFSVKTDVWQSFTGKTRLLIYY